MPCSPVPPPRRVQDEPAAGLYKKAGYEEVRQFRGTNRPSPGCGLGPPEHQQAVLTLPHAVRPGSTRCRRQQQAGSFAMCSNRTHQLCQGQLLMFASSTSSCCTPARCHRVWPLLPVPPHPPPTPPPPHPTQTHLTPQVAADTFLVRFLGLDQRRLMRKRLPRAQAAAAAAAEAGQPSTPPATQPLPQKLRLDL